MLEKVLNKWYNMLMEKMEKKSFWRRILKKGTNGEFAENRLYADTKKTTTKIKLALLELLNQKELSQINITELVQVAGIYRATFYLHYKNLNDVILDIEKDVCDCYNNIKLEVEDIDICHNITILIELIGEYIKLDKKYLKVIINTKCFNRITLSLKELLSDVVIDNFTKFGHMQYNDEFKLNISMFTGGLVFAYRDWINNYDMEFEVLENYIKKIGEIVFKKANK
jgi:AcrR family transcriptional regulator